MTRYKPMLAGIVICAIAAGAYAAWQGYLKQDIRRPDVSVTPPSTSAWYLSSGKFASCVKTGGPNQKISGSPKFWRGPNRR